MLDTSLANCQPDTYLYIVAIAVFIAVNCHTNTYLYIASITVFITFIVAAMVVFQNNVALQQEVEQMYRDYNYLNTKHTDLEKLYATAAQGMKDDLHHMTLKFDRKDREHKDMKDTVNRDVENTRKIEKELETAKAKLVSNGNMQDRLDAMMEEYSVMTTKLNKMMGAE